MFAVRSSVILAALVLSGCATPPDTERGVFVNPLAAPTLGRTGIGPECEIDFGRDTTCLGAPLIYPGRGRDASLGNGEPVRLTRKQARILRERAALIEELSDQPPPLTPPPPPAPVLPTADEGADERR